MPDNLFDDSHLISLWEEFAQGYCADALAKLEANYPTKRSLQVDFADISKFNGELADFLIERPDIALPAFEKVIKKPTAGVMDIVFEPHVRIFGIPDSNLLIQDVSSSHIDKLITVKGVVIKRAEVMHKVRIAIYKCLMCEHVMRVPITRKMIAPEVCPECKRRSLKLDEEGSYFVDIQRAEFQELLERIRGNAPAAKLELMVEDDLVNLLVPGESIEVTGCLRLRPPTKSKYKGETIAGSMYSRYFEVNYINSLRRDFEEIEISEEEEKQIKALSKDPKIYEHIQKAVAPGIYGHDEVKKAVVMQMFGGAKGKKMPGNMPIREDIHILLIGDPGSAKSRMLQYAKDLVPKGIMVSGKSATGAGLTAAAEKDELGDGGWTLKAGALVLASGGLACIDEFDKMREEDRSSMHEAMESQTVSVAKAGIVATFKTKCSILAAANPKFGRFDKNRLPAEQFDIPPTLLSRFDLIFVIYDVLDRVKDSEMADKILTAHIEYEKLAEVEKEGISRELLRKYIAYMRRNMNPQLSPEAAKKIKDYYVDLRVRGAQQGSVPITPRQIEGIVRLTEASAKVRASDVADADDAQRATELLDFMHDQILKDKETGNFDIDIIATGNPKSRVNKINTIFGFVKELNEQFDMVEINKVLEEAKKAHIDESEARRIIDELIYKGDLYKVKPGYVKIVEGFA
ncbi:AAA family ATPase [Candidatus Micrarchaeota archaeon CG10_big_fil_rev_8_21_14_0_10_45_29]|nr:MAG: AAA family ATPase [Candidatus Micrarchaeota archaeon CG10_big_fil_rev_8_21_14_0_10_45_29]